MQCRAVAGFFCYGGEGGGGGLIVTAEGKSLVGRSEGILPKKSFKFGGYETLFSALVMGYVSEKSTSNMKMANNCKSSQVKSL